MRIQAMCLALCAMVPMAANADGGWLDLHYTPIATIGDDEVAAKGDGFGARLHAEPGTALLNLEYSTADYSVFDESIDQLRLGLGLRAGESASIHAEYVDLDFLGEATDGFGVHVQFGQSAESGAGAYLRLGYLWLEGDNTGEIDGIEYAVGGRYPLGSVLGLLEFRSSRLEDEFGFEAYLEDLHLGIAVPFGR